ncbi:MAG: MBL fold metallo-hydrolase [Clostridia bacterium]|nr:MBL fold metallo-hydrolase [Clostridia bacterium]
MKLTFCPLFSGSSGNCTLVGADGELILIDAGLSGRQIVAALQSVGVLPEALSGIVVTHEHSDHVKGVGILSRKYRLPVYANEPTWNAMARQVGEIAPFNRRFFETGEDFYIGSLAIHPFAIPHDAADPVGFRVYYGARSVATATDMGHLKKTVLQDLAGTDVLLLESNHDPEMLRNNPHYTAALKARILGNRGHLSNEACGRGLCELYGTGVRHFVLGHLSGENNPPELAMKTAVDFAVDAGVVPDREVFIDMAWRDHVGKRYDIE